ncbi:MAG: hypothetical protein ACFE95_02660 [Candidatus Hodarchaeota archaeon]
MYIPKKVTKRIDNNWLYGRDLIEKLEDKHPEWNFIHVDGAQKNIYKDIDVLLRPSRHDGFPLMIAEARLFGIPTIWSYETGRYVEPDIDEIEGRLIEISNNKQL